MVKLRRLVTHNPGLKLLALIMAVVLWFMAVGRERAEVGLNVPVEMINFPKDMVIANEVPDGISVRIRGSVALTRQVQDRKLRFSLDLSGAQEGPNHFTVAPDNLDLPRGLEVTRLTPSTITVELEELITKKISLLPVIKGEPRAGYMIEDITLTPKQVKVRGPESKVATVDILWTEPLDVNDLDESTTLEASPALPDVSINLAEPVTIEARLSVAEKITSRPFKGVPVEILGATRPTEVSPTQVDVTVTGPVNAMTRLAAGDGLNVKVDVKNLGPGVYTRPLKVSAPEGVEVVEVKPEEAKVKIVGEPAQDYVD